MKIVMLLSNGFAPDPRVAAEAAALQEAGHQVTIFAWDRTGEFPAEGDYQGIKVIRCHIPTTYSRGPLQIFRFRLFWRECLRFLRNYPAEVIHCHDLDTLQPGVAYGRRYYIPVVYDAHESYPDMVAHLFPGPVVKLIRWMEQSLIPKTAAVITVGEILADHFRRMKAPQVVVVGNYKKLPAVNWAPAPITPPLKLIYVGGLNRDRLVGPVITALAGDERFEFLIVGDGPERERLGQVAVNAFNINFTGYLPQAEARHLIDQCHLVYYGIDGEFANNQFSTPNSLFMALAAGRPVLTTNVGEIAAIVRQFHCGTVLSDLQPETIRTALARYLDPAAWREQAESGFGAARDRYNWEQACLVLTGLYRQLEQTHG